MITFYCHYCNHRARRPFVWWAERALVRHLKKEHDA